MIFAYLSVKQKHMQMLNANKYFNKPYFNALLKMQIQICYLLYNEDLFKSWCPHTRRLCTLKLSIHPN